MNDAVLPSQTFTVMTEARKHWAAIATEIADYATRSFGDASAAIAKLASAKSLDEAISVQTEYAKRAYDEHLKQIAKIGGMYAEFAKSGLANTYATR